MSFKRTIHNYWNKFRFALRVSKGWPSFVQLIKQTKLYNKAYNEGKLSLLPKDAIRYNMRLINEQQVVNMRTYAGDLFVFYEVFLDEVYHIPTSYLPDAKTIVDLGAHIGFTSLYFAKKYSQARIVSIEASPINFTLLEKNIQSVKRIQAMHHAIYTRDTILGFKEDGLAHNNKIDVEGSVEINAISMPSLLLKCGIDHIDLLKIDIEGAEALLLSDNTSWLDKVTCIIIELHAPYTILDLKRDLEKHHFKIVDTTENSQLKNIIAYKN